VTGPDVNAAMVTLNRLSMDYDAWLAHGILEETYEELERERRLAPIHRGLSKATSAVLLAEAALSDRERDRWS
jgi:hypothetical protein